MKFHSSRSVGYIKYVFLPKNVTWNSEIKIERSYSPVKLTNQSKFLVQEAPRVNPSLQSKDILPWSEGSKALVKDHFTDRET